MNPPPMWSRSGPHGSLARKDVRLARVIARIVRRIILMSQSQAGLRFRWTRHEIVFFLGVGAVCLAVLVLSGKFSSPEVDEWHTPLFFRLVVPLAALGTFFGGFLFPGHSWRWGLAPWWMQHVYVLCSRGPGNIWPIAIIFWVLFLLPFVGLAKLGTTLSEYGKKKTSNRKVDTV